MRLFATALAAALALFALACGEAAGTPSIFLDALTPPPEQERAVSDHGLDVITIVVGEAELVVEVADAPAERQRGLSGREGLAETDGMLFHFESGRATSLWMKGMLFGLDFIWVGPDCTVVDLHRNVPAPGGPGESLPIYRPGAEAASVVEVAAGRTEELGIEVGDGVQYGTSASEMSYGCDGRGAENAPEG